MSKIVTQDKLNELTGMSIDYGKGGGYCPHYQTKVSLWGGVVASSNYQPNQLVKEEDVIPATIRFRYWTNISWVSDVKGYAYSQTLLLSSDSGWSDSLSIDCSEANLEEPYLGYEFEVPSNTTEIYVETQFLVYLYNTIYDYDNNPYHILKFGTDINYNDTFYASCTVGGSSIGSQEMELIPDTGNGDPIPISYVTMNTDGVYDLTSTWEI